MRKNQMSTGATYDAKGDVLTDSLHSYAWDVETRPTTIDSISVTYDALGRVVEEGNAGTYTQSVYAPTGFKIMILSGQTTLKRAYEPLPAGAEAVYTPSGLAYYRHADWLGSSRFASTPSRTMYNDLAYTPFGIPYAQAGTTGVMNTSFAGNNEDTTTSLYDAQFREYEIYGRWPSPDPAGVAAANPANPQSWNRYAYVMNTPLVVNDPVGMAPPGSHPCYPLATVQPCSVDDGGGETSVTLDGIDIPIYLGSALIEGGAALPCPYNSCTAVNSQTGQVGHAWASVHGPAGYYADFGPGSFYYVSSPYRWITISVTGPLPPNMDVQNAPLQTQLVQDYTAFPDLINGGYDYINNLPVDMFLTYGPIWGISDQITNDFNNMLSVCDEIQIVSTEAAFFGFGPFGDAVSKAMGYGGLAGATASLGCQ